jgi:hypothetical protein
VITHWEHNIISLWEFGKYLVETLIYLISTFIHPLKKSLLNYQCYHYTFNHLKAQPNTNGKTMSDFGFCCHLNVLSLHFQPFKSISVQEASLQYLVQNQAASHPDVIGSHIGWHTIGPALSRFGRGRLSLVNKNLFLTVLPSQMKLCKCYIGLWNDFDSNSKYIYLLRDPLIIILMIAHW